MASRKWFARKSCPVARHHSWLLGTGLTLQQDHGSGVRLQLSATGPSASGWAQTRRVHSSISCFEGLWTPPPPRDGRSLVQPTACRAAHWHRQAAILGGALVGLAVGVLHEALAADGQQGICQPAHVGRHAADPVLRQARGFRGQRPGQCGSTLQVLHTQLAPAGRAACPGACTTRGKVPAGARPQLGLCGCQTRPHAQASTWMSAAVQLADSQRPCAAARVSQVRQGRTGLQLLVLRWRSHPNAPPG